MQEKQKSLIEKIKLDSATFHGEEIEPTFVNFFFGKNGAGKSTIAKAIQNGTGITWATGQDPEDFVIAVYFCGREESGCTTDWMRSVVEFDILPMLAEYWFDEPAKLQRWEKNLRGVFDDE